MFGFIHSHFLELNIVVPHKQHCIVSVQILIRVAVFFSYMVVRKDIRELNSDCPPKADAGLKPGEFNVKL